MGLIPSSVILVAVVFVTYDVAGQPADIRAVPTQQVLESEMHHLRRADVPEWAEFASDNPDSQLTITFHSDANAADATLELTQRDVRYEWRIVLNGAALGILERDEQPMTIYREIPAGGLVAGTNYLTVAQVGDEVDDIMIGRISLFDRPRIDILSEGSVTIEVLDAETKEPLPSRITIIDAQRTLQTVAVPSDSAAVVHRAFRTGTIYTGDGWATFGVPEGSYTVYASRGFEYSADSMHVVVKPNSDTEYTLTLRREVPTEGWIAMDTHVHTLTHSGHGDATAGERVLTLAGEGIELPIITEHNKNINLRSLAESMGYGRYVVPIVGNEYTTSVGHFNVFPVGENDPVPDPDVSTWSAATSELRAAGQPEVVVLNHGRSTHAGFRPLGPRYFLDEIGRSRQRTPVPANAMEVINSSAQQADFMRLVKDWFGMQNAGTFLTPVGSSDSHDVARYLVGQGRTYVQVGNDAPDEIEIDHAIARFRNGHVVASFGLLPTISVQSEYGPGDLVPFAREVTVDARVLGPSWLSASSVALYMNGRKIRETAISNDGPRGEKWSGSWTIAIPSHDVFLSIVAMGPGDTPPFWPIAKPYQPESPVWTPHLIGITGVVWIDGDNDGRPTPARTYAERLVENAGGEWERVLVLLSDYDEAVAAQTAAELFDRGELPERTVMKSALDDAPPFVRSGYESFFAAVAQ